MADMGRQGRERGGTVSWGVRESNPEDAEHKAKDAQCKACVAFFRHSQRKTIRATMTRSLTLFQRFVFAALLVGGTPPLAADDWPQWRGPQRDGVWRETGIVDKFSSPQLQPVWTATVGPGYSGPTVAGDRVYLTDRVNEPVPQERVLCFDRHTGKPLWTHAYPCVYRDIDYALGPRAAVTVVDGRAFAYGAMGHAHALDAASGQILWARDLAT